jgi:hypothetical protein
MIADRGRGSTSRVAHRMRGLDSTKGADRLRLVGRELERTEGKDDQDQAIAGDDPGCGGHGLIPGMPRRTR